MTTAAPSGQAQARRGAPVDIQKDLVAASATPIVLSLLRQGDSYGYAIIRKVWEVAG